MFAWQVLTEELVKGDSLASLATMGPLFLAAFLAGLIDAIGGGGGLITIPTLLNLGIPPALLLGTNKTIACLGSLPALIRYRRAGLWPPLSVRLSLVLFCLAFSAAFLGAWLSSLAFILDRLRLLIPVLLLVVLLVMIRKWFFVRAERKALLASEDQGLSLALNRPSRLLALAGISAYDGLFGPGTGTFFLSYLESLGLKTMSANALTKGFNFASNLGALSFFAWQGKVIWLLGLAGASAYLLGNYLGSSLVLRRGQSLVRAFVILATLALLIKYLWQWMP